jgi:streptomycin 6-kinase
MTIEDKLLEIAAYTLPALITGGVAFVMMQKFYNSEESKRKFELLRENQKQALPIRLQAYERVVLLLERINPTQLLIRVAPTGKSKDDYATLLSHHIQTEFEHNLTQQIYLTAETWDIVLKAKNSTVQMIRKNALREDVADAYKRNNKAIPGDDGEIAPSDDIFVFPFPDAEIEDGHRTQR